MGWNLAPNLQLVVLRLIHTMLTQWQGKSGQLVFPAFALEPYGRFRDALTPGATMHV